MKRVSLFLALVIVLLLAVSCSQGAGPSDSSIVYMDNLADVYFDMSALSHYRIVIPQGASSIGINGSNGTSSGSRGISRDIFRFLLVASDGSGTSSPVQFEATDNQAICRDGSSVAAGTEVSQDDFPGTIDKLYVLGDYSLVSYLKLDVDKMIEEYDDGSDVLEGHFKSDKGDIQFRYTKSDSMMSVSLTVEASGLTFNETITVRSEDELNRPVNENENVTSYDTYGFYNSDLRFSAIIDNRTGSIYDIGEKALSVHNGIAYEKDAGPVELSINGNGELVVTSIIANPDIFVYSLFKDVYGHYFILNDSLNDVHGNYVFFTKPGAFIPTADGTVLHIEFNSSPIWNNYYGESARIESISSIKMVGSDLSDMAIPGGADISINYSAYLDFKQMPDCLADFNRNNGNSSSSFPSNGSWHTFTEISDGYLFTNYFRGDKAMVYCRINLSNYEIRMNYYFAESDEFYYGLGNNAALIISDSLNSDGSYGVYVVYPFDSGEYRQRAFDIVIETNGNIREEFNTSNASFADVHNYNDFRNKFFRAYLLVNSDCQIYDSMQPSLTDYRLDVLYNPAKGQNDYIYYVWKPGFSEDTFRDLYYNDPYDREELGKHTILQSVKYESDKFRKVSNPMDFEFKVIEYSKTSSYRLAENNGSYSVVLVNESQPRDSSIVMQPINLST